MIWIPLVSGIIFLVFAITCAILCFMAESYIFIRIILSCMCLLWCVLTYWCFSQYKVTIELKHSIVETIQENVD